MNCPISLKSPVPYMVKGEDTNICAHQGSSGMSTNGLTLARKNIKKRILFGLTAWFMAPDMVEDFAREDKAEMKRFLQVMSAKGRAPRRLAAESPIFEIALGYPDDPFVTKKFLKSPSLHFQKERTHVTAENPPPRDVRARS